MHSPSELSRQKRFGRIIRERRDELGLTQLQIGDLGGPSAPTIRKIEDGEAAISMQTLNKLDAPLRWLPGSAARTYAGGVPAADEPADASRAAGESVVAGPDAIRFEISDLTGLLAASGRLTDAVENGRTSDPQVVAAIAELNRVVSKLSARYATAMLERNGGPGRQLHPLVEMAFAHLLAVPAESSDPGEIQERRYRRWLAGRSEDIDAATDARFRARWLAANAATASVRNGE
ncbi:helix-turn-helix domain-containing protein [Nocardia gipuzkoensis]|uniref:helix-turn-helix domain-containing protein n=1 Tax=Nocardia TaxID=1817 RepID=UPI001893838C|nr:MULTISPECIES: helix-turn-helix transcriptional regulator [Nocardia]MBF6218172.1 helix-turn-helix domain-containing protein [Nocardia abscessus]MDE1670459.1 helix-turn-helix transcriptional regulator [Nocardia gipuzkoensis]UGT65595.1 helix-turn-helix domain-containing protein [Nocardia gipuzkoensis]